MKYIKPDFDVTKYEVEDILTASMFTNEDPDGEGWDD